jgi:hypothetical protein
MDAIVILPLAVSILIGGFPKRQSFGHSRFYGKKKTAKFRTSFGGLESPKLRKQDRQALSNFWRSSSPLAVFICSKTPGFPPFLVKAAINSANFSLPPPFWRK